MESGLFVKGCERSAAGRDNARREGSSETARTPRTRSKSWVEGHIFSQGGRLILRQRLRQPLGAGTAVLAVHGHRNACQSINETSTEAQKGLLFPS